VSSNPKGAVGCHNLRHMGILAAGKKEKGPNEMGEELSQGVPILLLRFPHVQITKRRRAEETTKTGARP